MLQEKMYVDWALSLLTETAHFNRTITLAVSTMTIPRPWWPQSLIWTIDPDVNTLKT